MQTDTRRVKRFFTCIAAAVTLAVAVVLAGTVIARAEGGSEKPTMLESVGGGSSSSDIAASKSDKSSSATSTTADKSTSAAKVKKAPKKAPAPANDDMHDANGLPNYGLRIVLDPNSKQYIYTNDAHAIGMDIRVRAKSASASGSVVLERWHKNQYGRYELLAQQHLSVPADGWGDNDNQSTIWFWQNGFNWQNKNGEWYTKDTVFDFNNKDTDWQRLAFVMHHWGQYSGYEVGSFDTSSDVWVLRAADTSAGAMEAGKSSEAYEYEIESILWCDQKLSYGVSSSTDDPKSITTWIPVAEGGYDSFTGVRTLPTSGVETLDITAQTKNQKETQYHIENSWNGDASYGLGDGGYFNSFTENDAAHPVAQHAVIVRNEVEGNEESYGSMPVSLTIFCSRRCL